MDDALLEVLKPYIKSTPSSNETRDPLNDATARSYLQKLSTSSIHDLTTTEDESLSSAAQTNLRSLQALSKRSHSAIITATELLQPLTELIESTSLQSAEIHEHSKYLEETCTDFAKKYDRTSENDVLDRRKTAALLSRNNERINNILELPSLLASAVSVSTASSTGSGTGGSSGAAIGGYASALEIHAHIKRLASLYPTSALVADVLQQADEEILTMTSGLIKTLQSPGLKLAAAVRTIGWLRRISPQLSPINDRSSLSNSRNFDDSLDGLFLVCRMTTLRRTLDALDPLKILADGETERRLESKQNPGMIYNGGIQSERYLKRFLEIYREQSFTIISMYKSVFPTALPVPNQSSTNDTFDAKAMISEEPSASLASFMPKLIQLLLFNIQRYLPNVREKSSRDSLLSQVLFCAGSLGRLGADFAMLLASSDDADDDNDENDHVTTQKILDEPEWIDVMHRHKIQANRLELLASSVNTGKKSTISPDETVEH